MPSQASPQPALSVHLPLARGVGGGVYRRPPLSLDAPPLPHIPSRTCRPSEQHLPRPASASPAGGCFSRSKPLAFAHYPLLTRRPGTCPPGPPPSRAHTCPFRWSISLCLCFAHLWFSLCCLLRSPRRQNGGGPFLIVVAFLSRGEPGGGVGCS